MLVSRILTRKNLQLSSFFDFNTTDQISGSSLTNQQLTAQLNVTKFAYT